MMSELKPCPFCGGGARVFELKPSLGEDEVREFVLVYCQRCNISTPRIYVNFRANKPPYETERIEAITAWNTRATTPLDDPRVTQLVEAADDLRKIIRKAGVENLMNGVQLGQISWMVKCNDALIYLDTALKAMEQSDD